MPSPSLFDFLRDSESMRNVRQGVTDALNRGMVAGALGAPVDLATQAANLGVAGVGYAGHKLGLLSAPPDLMDSRNVPGSSEWIGQKMQNAGAVSASRNAPAEFAAGLLSMGAPKAAQKVGGLLYQAEQNAARTPTMPLRGQRGVLRVSDAIDPIDAKYPGAKKFVSDVERLSEDNGKIFARWSASEAHDMTPGAVSQDFVSGGRHAGLSAVPIDGTTHPVDIAKSLAEYNFLRMNDPKVTLRVYSGKQVGVDSDGYASITPTGKVIDVPPDFIKHIDRGFVKAYELADKIKEATSKLEQTTGSSRQIWQDALNKDQAALAELLKK